MTNTGPRCRSGFTLLELLIVVAIVALLIAIALPAIGKAKKSTLKTVCAAYQHQLMTADNCGSARIALAALDCGCYGELGKDLYAFDFPEDMTEAEFRKQLESDVIEACK